MLNCWFCLRMLNCKMFRLFALFFGLLLCYPWVAIRCGVDWRACMWWLTLECIEWLVHVLSSMVFCLCCVAGCFVDVAFPCVCILSDVEPAAFYVCPVCWCYATADWSLRACKVLVRGRTYVFCLWPLGCSLCPPPAWVVLEGPIGPANLPLTSPQRVGG